MIFLQILMEASSGIENIIIMTDDNRLDLGGLQIERHINNNCTSQLNQALSRCFFSVFGENLGTGISTIFQLSIMHAFQQLLGFVSFTVNLNNEIAKIP